MATQKDRLGEKLHDAEKAQEDQYFAKRDQELIEKLRSEREKEFTADLKAAATMRCPRCGQQLQDRVEHGVRAEECLHCGGVWLDRGEFETLASREERGWLGHLLRTRQTPAKGR